MRTRSVIVSVARAIRPTYDPDLTHSQAQPPLVGRRLNFSHARPLCRLKHLISHGLWQVLLLLLPPAIPEANGEPAIVVGDKSCDVLAKARMDPSSRPNASVAPKRALLATSAPP